MYRLCSKPDSRTIPLKMDLFENDEIIAHQEMITLLRTRIESILKNYRPVMNGEIYLSGEDVCKLLHISKRTLQQYRDDNILPYIQIGGKIIYKESDILTILEQNYISQKQFDCNLFVLYAVKRHEFSIFVVENIENT